MQSLIAFFANKHLLANLVFFGTLVAGYLFWVITPKEEMPDFTFDFVRIQVVFPGASASEVEYSVTRPIEQELRSLDGIYRIRSTSSQNSASINVELEKKAGQDPAILSDIRDAVYGVKLPDAVDELPNIRQFKTSKKAIIDICLYLDDKEFLNPQDRLKLQEFSLNLENRLVALDQINSVNRKGFLQQEVQILLDSSKLYRYQTSIQSVAAAIQAANTRQPAGTLENLNKDRVTVDGELRDKKSLAEVVIQGGFEGNFVRLSDVAEIVDGFEDSNEVLKINGHEAIVLNVVKTGTYGILDSVDLVKAEIAKLQKSLKNSNIRVLALDDESRDVRNRIKLIGSNGIIGFTLILIALFLFLNLRTGIWVALGIPFTFSVTLCLSYLLGFTINNMTLAAVIIVMGMIVDDAIVVSENIVRLRSQGVPALRAAIEGTSYVLLPVVASITTTCVAFLPLLTFDGHLSLLSDVIPPIVIIMLVASLIESLLILPAHLSYEFSHRQKVVFSLGAYLLIEKFFATKTNDSGQNSEKPHWFDRHEERFAHLLARCLQYRKSIFAFFVLVSLAGGALFIFKMKFVLFPREETDQIRIKATAPDELSKYETAKLAKKIEDVFSKEVGKEIVGFRTSVGHTGFRSSPQENRLSMRVELIDVQERPTPLKVLTKKWQKELKKIKGFKSIRISKGRFGSDSGTAIEVVIEENNDEKRLAAAKLLATELEKFASLKNVEIDQPFQGVEHRVVPHLRRLKRLGAEAGVVADTIRTIIEGKILYKIYDENSEEINIRLSVKDQEKGNLARILALPVSNDAGYLVPIRHVVQTEETSTSNQIERLNGRRVLKVYADLKQDAKQTPLEVASQLEQKVFTAINAQFPTTSFSFDGEVKDSQESRGFFLYGIIASLLMIFMILALQFGSFSRPVVVLAAIGPATAFVIVVFVLHGMSTYGFFAAIGVMGLSGVIVNDAIILVQKLDDTLQSFDSVQTSTLIEKIALATSTRLKAVLLTTITTAAGLIPTAYGFAGYDAMLAEMMLALAWGLIFGTFVILILVPAIYTEIRKW